MVMSDGEEEVGGGADVSDLWWICGVMRYGGHAGACVCACVRVYTGNSGATGSRAAQVD